MDKKGALELSITAIVVLIIAITLLGLAIFFIKNLFKGGTEIFTGELAKIKEQLRTNLEESGELFVFSIGSEIEIKKGEPQKFYMGVRNTARNNQEPFTVCYRISIKCIQPFNEENSCTAVEPRNALVGGKDIDGNTPVEAWFTTMLSELDIPNDEIEITPATLQIARANPDTYLMEAKVYKANEDVNCEVAGSFAEFQTKRFHIILK